MFKVTHMEPVALLRTGYGIVRKINVKVIIRKIRLYHLTILRADPRWRHRRND